MPWFTEDAIAFFADLEQNNDQEWFEANRKRYESSVKEPMREFAAEMIGRMQALDPDITMLPKDAIFRIHRDTRFSKGKPPYKINAGLVVTRGKKHAPGVTGLYFHFDASRMGIASGLYFLEPFQIAAVRRQIVDNLDEFERLLANPEWRSAFGEMAGARNKVVPAEFREAAERQPLVANKQFFYWSEHPAREILRGDLADFVMSRIQSAQPLNRFLTAPL